VGDERDVEALAAAGAEAVIAGRALLEGTLAVRHEATR
jgi:phosphoribosylformimino-5-aminoimidazole carboxamide ribonucleotide (ProFAR) isomerase